MAVIIYSYMCPSCKHTQNTDFSKCPACGVEQATGGITAVDVNERKKQINDRPGKYIHTIPTSKY